MRKILFNCKIFVILDRMMRLNPIHADYHEYQLQMKMNCIDDYLN